MAVGGGTQFVSPMDHRDGGEAGTKSQGHGREGAWAGASQQGWLEHSGRLLWERAGWRGGGVWACPRTCCQAAPIAAAFSGSPCLAWVPLDWWGSRPAPAAWSLPPPAGILWRSHPTPPHIPALASKRSQRQWRSGSSLLVKGEGRGSERKGGKQWWQTVAW